MSKPQRRFGPACPHCGSNANVRTSRQISNLVGESYHACTSLECGATFASQTQIVRMISPSNTPNPRVHLPMTPPRAPMRRVLPAGNDNWLPAAKDNPLEAAAEA